MIKYLKALAISGGLGIGLAACGNNGSTVLTPPPPPTTTTYYQIERLSRPAIKEVFESFNNHKTSNGLEPYDNANDPLFASIKATEDFLRPPKGTIDYGAALQGIFYPDKIAVNLAQTGNASYLGVELNSVAPGAFPASFGGRYPTDDVVGLSLAAAFGGALSPVLGEDNEENNCLAAENLNPSTAGPIPTGTFPYLAAAR